MTPCLALALKAPDREPGPKPQIGPGASNRLNATQTFRSASGLTYLRAPCQFEGSWGLGPKAAEGHLTEDSEGHLTEDSGAITEDSEGHLTEVMFSSGILPVFFRYAGKINRSILANVLCHTEMVYRVF